MSTLSVPLDKELLDLLDWLIDHGIAPNKAEAVRMALKKFGEEQAVEAVLRAQKEPSLHGDIDTLARKVR